jgi:aryl-alcohol dehydrogenase-like predicted oxidoreductase
VKYRLIIDEWGGWEPFQQLLGALHAVAERHQTSVGAVALRWVLDQPGVSAAIVGARHARPIPGTLAALSLTLGESERAELAGVMGAGGGAEW